MDTVRPMPPKCIGCGVYISPYCPDCQPHPATKEWAALNDLLSFDSLRPQIDAQYADNGALTEILIRVRKIVRAVLVPEEDAE